MEVINWEVSSLVMNGYFVILVIFVRFFSWVIFDDNEVSCFLLLIVFFLKSSILFIVFVILDVFYNLIGLFKKRERFKSILMNFFKV